MSPDPAIKALAVGFSELAQSFLTSRGLRSPRLTSVQALLCCAYYEVGKGNLSKAWQLSGMLRSVSVMKVSRLTIVLGMAFRMGQDLGFQRDPTHWEPKRRLMEPYFDNEFRRRLYWAAFCRTSSYRSTLFKPQLTHICCAL